MKFSLFVILLLISAEICHAQAINLLKNPNADEALEKWKGKSAVVERENGNNIFVLRGDGELAQEVLLPQDSVDKFVVFFGRAASDQVHPDNTWAGLPSLYGYMDRSSNPRGGRINAYLTGANMVSRAKTANEWNYVWGIFPVPVGTKNIDYFVQKGATHNLPQDSSTAKFDDLGLYLFATEQEAKEFVSAKIGKPIEVKIRKNARMQPCTLSIEQAPKLFGIGFGMTLQEVLELFPGISKENSIGIGVKDSQAIAELKYGDLMFDPRKYSENPDLSNVKTIALRFWNGRVYSIQSETDANPYETVPGDASALIRSYSKKMALPALTAWENVHGITAKYCICNGFEISFYAAPLYSANGNQISIIDTNVERRIYGR